MRKKVISVASQKRREAYFFILPAFIYILLVMGYPMIYNVVLSNIVERSHHTMRQNPSEGWRLGSESMEGVGTFLVY